MLNAEANREATSARLLEVANRKAVVENRAIRVAEMPFGLQGGEQFINEWRIVAERDSSSQRDGRAVT